MANAKHIPATDPPAQTTGTNAILSNIPGIGQHFIAAGVDPGVENVVAVARPDGSPVYTLTKGQFKHGRGINSMNYQRRQLLDKCKVAKHACFLKEYGGRAKSIEEIMMIAKVRCQLTVPYLTSLYRKVLLNNRLQQVRARRKEMEITAQHDTHTRHE
jgi:hypothetical protein